MSWPFDIEHRIKDDLIKSDDAYSPELRARIDMWYRRIFPMHSNEHPPLNAPAGSSGFTAAVSDQPEWPHTTTLEADHFVNGERQPVLKEYRWRFEADLNACDQPRIIAQHRRLPAGGWSEVRSPDRLAQLRALASPA